MIKYQRLRKKFYFLDSYNLQTKYILNNNISSIDIVKIDTEGNDLKILQDMCKVLDEVEIKLFKIEILFQNNKNFSSENYYKILQTLKEHEFSFVGLSNSKYKNNRRSRKVF